MIISLNWLKKYVDIDIPTDELVELIGSRLVEVEGTIDLGEKYRGIKIVEVKSVEKIEGSDHLSKCMVWDGKNETQLVCGAPNVRAGMLAVWLSPGTVLPATFDSEPLVLEKRKIRGVESAGMLGAMDELDLGADHEGIIEVNPSAEYITCHPELDSGSRKKRATESDKKYDWIPDQVRNDKRRVQPGDDFAEVFGLNDILLDIENKSLTHRPDCFGVIGFAREVAGILGQPAGDFLNNPDKNGSFKELHFADDVKLKVTIEDAKLCPRYQAVVLDGFSEKSSKYLSEMAVLLAKSGMRSINPIVDVTNYLMLLTGQPLHAFDYDKLLSVGRGSAKPKPNGWIPDQVRDDNSAHIIVRAAKKGDPITTSDGDGEGRSRKRSRDGEEIELLDGRVVQLDPGDILITSNNVPVALAGAMGGANTEIDEKTKRIVIESATFSLYNLRSTQFRHGIFSEAITRFTKGQPPALTDPVLREATRILTSEHGMKAVSEIVDAYPKPIKNKPIKVSAEQVNNVLGSDFTFDDIITTLENVGFKIVLSSSDLFRGSNGHKRDSRDKHENDDAHLRVTVPWWRTDVHIPEDVIEEVGRLNGYDNIPAVLPKRDFIAPEPDKMGVLKSKIRQILSAAGANEVLTYSFVSEKLLENVGQDPKNSYKIINSISPDLQYVRQSLTPSLLEKVRQNLRVGYDEFALFEINKLYQKKWGMTDEKVPIERDKVAFVLASSRDTLTPYYRAKKFADSLFNDLGITARYEVLTEDNASDIPFEIKRRSKIVDSESGLVLGVIGEYKTNVRKNFRLPAAAGFELILDNILILISSGDKQSRRAESRYQDVERDVTFRVCSELEYAKLENLLCRVLEEKNLWFECVPVSVYQGDDRASKNISFKLTFASYEKTLNGDEIAGIMDEIAEKAKSELKASVI